MIKTKKGETSLEGSKMELFADYGCIVNAIKVAFRGKGMSDEDIKAFFDDSFSKGWEFDEAKANSAEKLEKLNGLLDELLKILGDDEEEKEDK